MNLDPESVKPAITRLKRARGQLDAIIAALEAGEDCQATMVQLAAASKAIDRAGFLVVSTGLKQCLASGNEMDEVAIEKMFLSLA